MPQCDGPGGADHHNPRAARLESGQTKRLDPRVPAWIIISAKQLFQLQSPGRKRGGANPHALWAQDPSGGSEVRE